jgi:acetyl esterase/lipase
VDESGGCMKITYKMIDKQLRVKGFLYDLLTSSPSEAKFLQAMHSRKKQMKRYIGKVTEGLDCSEDWIARKDGSKLRVRIYKPLNPKPNVPGVLWLHGGS